MQRALIWLLILGAVRFYDAQGLVAYAHRGGSFVSGTPVRMLPEGDRNALSGGIWVFGEAAAALTEDFCS